jgi:hypothetical protein
MTSDALKSQIEEINDAVSDVRHANLQSLTSAISRLSTIVDRPPLGSFLLSLHRNVDFAAWYKAAGTHSAVAGSGTLQWPSDRDERVVLQRELCSALASGKVSLTTFLFAFCNTGSPHAPLMIGAFVDKVVDPFVRDVRRLTEASPLPALLEDIRRQFPPSGDDALDSLLSEAIQKYREPTARKDALERLWDCWERLKSIDIADDKRRSVELLLQNAAPAGAFREVIETEAASLTKIGNRFQIRHFESNREPLTNIIHVEYLFLRLYSFMYLLVSTRNTAHLARVTL